MPKVHNPIEVIYAPDDPTRNIPSAAATKGYYFPLHLLMFSLVGSMVAILLKLCGVCQPVVFRGKFFFIGPGELIEDKWAMRVSKNGHINR